VLSALVKSYTPEFVTVSHTPSTVQPLPPSQGTAPDNSIIGHRVLIGRGSYWKGYRGEVRQVGLKNIIVVIGQPPLSISCRPSELIDL